ncbi:uncharacterized protein [Leptinotarsa decemlineata]|uniref:uncharacterized protein n=1 Tax=Leptinotarsa decemlineata TaxID=7539 RepID=UPI003D309798
MASDSFSSEDNSRECFKEVQNEPRVVTQYDNSVWKNIVCLETGCNFTFETKKALMGHLIKTHDLSFELEESEVTNWQEFQTWKDLMEEREKCHYVLFSRKYDKITNQTLSLMFSCLGNRTIKGENEQSQLEHSCTSVIEAKEVSESLISIEWIRTHYGHICNSMNVNVKIERDLDLPPVDKDMEVVQPEFTFVKVEEKSSTTNCIQTPVGFGTDDSTFSLDSWVSECGAYQDNPVLFYKPSNCTVEGFSIDDFCLIVMTNFQADMLKMYPDIVAIDSTYGLEDCEFELTTLLIIDKKGELFPAAFMITNNDSRPVSTFFFEHVREKVGAVSPQIFISEMTGKFHDSWSAIMGPITNWLFCSCHLEHIWKLNLLNIKNRDKRIWVYETLKELQLTSEEEKFINALDSAINEILNDQETFAFGEAFQHSYVDCIRQWVYCYRKELGLEADIFLDSMKQMVRHPGCRRKIKKRDEVVCDMLQYVRDKTVSCIVEVAEGDLKEEIDRNHDRSVQNAFAVLKCSESLWKLRLGEEDSSVYSVVKLSGKKCCDVTCCKCDICVHMYSCSCPAYFINSKICEHIHHIAFTYAHSRNRAEGGGKYVAELDQDDAGSAVLSTVSNPELISKVVHKTIMKLQSADFSNMPRNVSSQVLTHLLALNSLITFGDNDDVNSVGSFVNEQS